MKLDTDTIVIPRPHVPFGPVNKSPNEADVDYLLSAADDLEEFYKPFGSNLRATVVKLLRDSAEAIKNTRFRRVGATEQARAAEIIRPYIDAFCDSGYPSDVQEVTVASEKAANALEDAGLLAPTYTQGILAPVVTDEHIHDATEALFEYAEALTAKDAEKSASLAFELIREIARSRALKAELDTRDGALKNEGS